jgi:hypothetical protein
MANYINKNIISQAYLHIETDDLGEEEIEKLKNHLSEFVRSRTNFFLYPEADIDIKFKEGSLKVYVTILGILSSLYAGVANYPDFREGSIVLYNDSKRLAEYILSESLFSTKAKHHDIIRVESRTGVVGSIHKIISQLNSVVNMDGVKTAIEMKDRLKEAKEELNKLLVNLKSSDDKIIVSSGLTGLAEKLPRKPKSPPRKSNSPASIALYVDERKYFIKILNKNPANN